MSLQMLREAQKEAMRAKEKLKLNTIRMAISAIRQIEIDDQKTLTDDEVIAVIAKLIKQRKDAQTQYLEAGREDLAQTEASEMLILQAFLPEPLTQTQIDELIDQAITQAEATSMQDMGKVMNLLKPKLQGRADLSQVSQQIKARL